jgi:hypothetical protein
MSCPTRVIWLSPRRSIRASTKPANWRFDPPATGPVDPPTPGRSSAMTWASAPASVITTCHDRHDSGQPWMNTNAGPSARPVSTTWTDEPASGIWLCRSPFGIAHMTSFSTIERVAIMARRRLVLTFGAVGERSPRPRASGPRSNPAPSLRKAKSGGLHGG